MTNNSTYESPQSRFKILAELGAGSFSIFVDFIVILTL
jgi:hypothetical protein